MLNIIRLRNRLDCYVRLHIWKAGVAPRVPPTISSHDIILHSVYTVVHGRYIHILVLLYKLYYTRVWRVYLCVCVCVCVCVYRRVWSGYWKSKSGRSPRSSTPLHYGLSAACNDRWRCASLADFILDWTNFTGRPLVLQQSKLSAHPAVQRMYTSIFNAYNG